jgi:23S rRNA (cytosine1962-C5)-methyltransferase
VEALLPAIGNAEVVPGALVTVQDGRSALLGTALYSSASMIALRLVVREKIVDRNAFLQLLRARLQWAIQMRQEILAAAPATHATDACRLVFSEADELPGIIVDRYGVLVILQLLTQGTHAEDVRAVVVETLRAMLDPDCIVERPDPRIRELEQLAAPPSGPLYARTPEQPLLQTWFHLNGLRFYYDAEAGQKTGAFLDQSENYAAAARHAHGRALDICTYQGGFALHLARVCPQVTGVDASRAALEVAERNLVENQDQLLDAGRGVEWIEANAFDLLRDWSDAGERFDTIVLDPPAFAKSKRAIEGALRGYKEMNLRALKMLQPGGTLVTCSCSQHVSLADFTAVVAAAAGDAGRRVRLLETRGAALDHPAILTIPETHYLKCLVCRVE